MITLVEADKMISNGKVKKVFYADDGIENGKITFIEMETPVDFLWEIYAMRIAGIMTFTFLTEEILLVTHL